MVYINDQFKFIFIENPKSGSTSVIKAFERIFHKPIRRNSPQQAHLTCEQIKKKIPDKWETYLKVTTYRDPFERFCSSVYFKKHQMEGRFDNIEKFKKHKSDRCVYCLPQELFTESADFIIHLCNFQQDFDTFCQKVGIQSVKIERVNSKSKNIICSKEKLREIMIPDYKQEFDTKEVDQVLV